MVDILLKELGEHLQQSAGAHAFLLVDPLLREPFPVDWEPLVAAQSWEIPVNHPGFGKDQRPRLVQIEARNVGLLEASLVAALQEQDAAQEEVQNGFCIGGWLSVHGTVSGEYLARHLATCMRLPANTSRKAQVFRWHDRRVLEWMWPVLSDTQRARLLSPLTSWVTLDRRRQLRRYQAPASAGTVAGMSLDEAQLQHAKLGQVAQDLLRGWGEFVDELPAGYLAQVASAVSAISEIGMENRQDSTLLGAYILQVHPLLTLHPKVRAALEIARSGRTTLSQALEQIPDPSGWDDIRADLNRQHQRHIIEQGKEVRHG